MQRRILTALSLFSVGLVYTYVTPQHSSLAHPALQPPVVAKFASAPAARPTPTPDLPVTTNVSDFIDTVDSNGVSQRIWMQLRSDGAAYTNGISVESIIKGVSGDWILDSKNATSPARNMFFDFTKPIPATGPNGGAPVAPFSSALVAARFISKCHLYNNDLFTMTAGSTVNCPLAIFSADNGKEYFLHMNPVTGAEVSSETDYVNVTCNGTANFQCNNWTLMPSGLKGGCATGDCSVRQNIARLSLRVPAKGKSGTFTTLNQGDFYVSFSIGVTNP